MAYLGDLIRSLGGEGGYVLSLIVTPLGHGIAHGEHLTLESRTSSADGHVHAQLESVAPTERTVFLGNDQSGDFFAILQKSIMVCGAWQTS